MTVLTYDIVYSEYVVNLKSDEEIAEKYGLHRTTVGGFRERYGIETRLFTHDLAHSLVKEALLDKGYSIRDAREKSKTSRFNFLVNRVAGVQVLSSEVTKSGTSVFTIKTREESDVVEGNRFFVQLRNGKWRKDLSKSCDIVILCSILGDKKRLFIVPSKLFPLHRSSISIPRDMGKWSKYLNQWSELDRVIQRKRGTDCN